MNGDPLIANTAEPITRENLRDQCGLALTRRQESYPAMIEAGRITEEAAARDIEGWRMLDNEWRWNCLGDRHSTRPFLLGLSPEARAIMMDAVNLALDRIDTELNRLGGGGNQRPELLRQHDLNRTLRLHIEAARPADLPMERKAA